MMMYGKKRKSWGIYNQIQTHSPFCKYLIIKHSQVTHKIENFAVFKGVFSADSETRRFKSYRTMQCQNFCHTGGCKNSFTLKRHSEVPFFNIAPQTGKTTPAYKFLSNTTKRPDAVFCAEFFLNLGQVPMWQKYATFSVVNFSKQLTLLAEFCDNREAYRRGMKSPVSHRLHPADTEVPYFC